MCRLCKTRACRGKQQQQQQQQCGTCRYVARPTHGPLFEGLAARDALWVEEQFPYGATPVLRAPVRVVEGADGSHRVEPEIVAADKDEL